MFAYIKFRKRKEYTVYHKTYINKFLKPMLSTLKKGRSLAGLKTMKILHDDAIPHVIVLI